ncbi:MAG: tRNA-queuosine alpha-mannosyltransferase domain-containing protein [bacterium]
MRRLNVLFLESFYGGSHKAFADGYVARSAHAVDLRTLPGQEWRRRQRLAGAAFAESVGSTSGYDVVVATDLIDLADFTARVGNAVPVVLYMHETQCTYPPPKGRTIDDDTVFFDVKNTRLAGAVVFNSWFHRRTFLAAIEPRLRQAHEIDADGWNRHVRRHSCVVYPGVDVAEVQRLAREHRAGTYGGPERRRDGRRTPNIVWNHRWEYDKNPSAFFHALDALAAKGVDFTVTVMGESSQAHPKDFEEARVRLGERIRHFGYVEERRRYIELLAEGDITVSTSNQENFGIATVEAIAAGCLPILPHRLSYPELLPEEFHDSCLYTSQGGLVKTLTTAVLARAGAEGAGGTGATGAADTGDADAGDPTDAAPDTDNGRAPARLHEAMRRYDWSHSAPALDEVVEAVARGRSPGG